MQVDGSIAARLKILETLRPVFTQPSFGTLALGDINGGKDYCRFAFVVHRA